MRLSSRLHSRQQILISVDGRREILTPRVNISPSVLENQFMEDSLLCLEQISLDLSLRSFQLFHHISNSLSSSVSISSTLGIRSWCLSIWTIKLSSVTDLMSKIFPDKRFAELDRMLVGTSIFRISPSQSPTPPIKPQSRSSGNLTSNLLMNLEELEKFRLSLSETQNIS